ncbi:carbohydrate ABC transporter membrane protein 1, CUT1 family (TC 3.A.1.1.-) [Kaistia soli DSM 19436]|uniref:Carbohydrate ABC transporter membrane protein 1, CUT1 family (TC 3.A.1.1.-) n=1 Tax=Kaistia soli DSM 19436 TaxID=1122133 RepID=A0A1M4WV19_9HYPH|nr:sugar ABC transporter permease [Kaistia soli]SHE85089.1 carbohydrate ABC transporter membrane protein 1, CUT1 family (TC 3.A.1.1.-) [Kaistia soli DSM 19436]
MTATPSISASGNRPSELKRAQARAGYLFILPSFALYLTFVLAPVIVTFLLAFTYYDAIDGASFVGLDNFKRFFTDGRSLEIFWNTLRFAFFAVTFNVGVGLALALALNRAMPAFLLYFFRLAFFLPVIIAAAFVSIVWGYFYGDDLGIINYYLIRLGITPVRWLTSSSTAMMSIIIMDVWKNTGFFMIIFIAALQGVPKTIMDAAIMDGASYWRRFSRIILPWISPVIFFNIVYASIGAMQVYESIVILTSGGPGDSTRSMSIYIVEEAFGSFEIGYAASVSVILTFVILILTSLQLIASRRWVSY